MFNLVPAQLLITALSLAFCGFCLGAALAYRAAAAENAKIEGLMRSYLTAVFQTLNKSSLAPTERLNDINTLTRVYAEKLS